MEIPVSLRIHPARFWGAVRRNRPAITWVAIYPLLAFGVLPILFVASGQSARGVTITLSDIILVGIPWVVPVAAFWKSPNDKRLYTNRQLLYWAAPPTLVYIGASAHQMVAIGVSFPALFIAAIVTATIGWLVMIAWYSTLKLWGSS